MRELFYEPIILILEVIKQQKFKKLFRFLIHKNNFISSIKYIAQYYLK